DRASFPRDKVCGDFVGPAALDELAGLGVTGTAAFAATNTIGECALHGQPDVQLQLDGQVEGTAPTACGLTWLAPGRDASEQLGRPQLAGQPLDRVAVQVLSTLIAIKLSRSRRTVSRNGSAFTTSPAGLPTTSLTAVRTFCHDTVLSASRASRRSVSSSSC